MKNNLKSDYAKYLSAKGRTKESIIKITIYIIMAATALAALSPLIFLETSGYIGYCFLGLIAALGSLFAIKKLLLPRYDMFYLDHDEKPHFKSRRINIAGVVAFGVVIFYAWVLIYVAIDDAFFS